METNRLRQFCTVVETGNLRKAGELLGISHSGLFKSLKVLEEELGIPLFVPSGRGIVVTDPGRELYERSARFFSELKHLLGQDKPTAQDLIRLGSFEVFTTFFIGRLLKDYLPKTQVEIHELVPGKLEEALLLNRIDLGITYEPVPRPKIEYVKIGRVNMAAFATKDTFAGHDLAQIPFAVPVNPLEGAPSGVKGLDAWPEQKYRRNAAYRVDLMATGLELTRQGLCAIFIPEFVAKLHNESAPARFHLHALPLPKAMAQVHRDIYLLQRESSIESRTTKKVAQALREVCI
ncbi:MAG: LysR family transcriptional regulator [Bdellovibrionales bacterium]|nr:LysR family transcriptional regulator [Oligoflexia bacterium]